MHHPGCWVRNGGCATKTDHKPVPIAEAYVAEAPVSGEAPHPGEGTRVAAPRAAAPAPPVQLHRDDSSGPIIGEEDLPDEGMVIGGAPPPTPRMVPGPAPAGEPKRRKPPVAAASGYKVDRSGKPMPSVYGRHRLLRYWYVPAAVLVAVGVAFGVIWVAGLFGDDDDPDLASGETAGDATSTVTTTSSAPAGDQTPGTPTAPAATGKFQVDDLVVVTGVGSGGGDEAPCLNVRTEPGTDSVIIDCLVAGTQLTVSGGPEEAGGFTWWRVKLVSGDGWAAEEYLVER